MSKFHGEQYWTTVRNHTLQSWRDLNDDDLDTLRAIGHDHEVRERSARQRIRRERRLRPREFDA